MLDMEERVPNVLCDDEKDFLDFFFEGEGVRRKLEEWVLLLETELCVGCAEPRRISLESF
jgi:hypothetical protein